jgi:hypothetical protein
VVSDGGTEKEEKAKTMTRITVGKRGDTRASWHEERKGTEKGESPGGAGGESVWGRKMSL